MLTTRTKLVDMLSYMRPAYSTTELIFCMRFLQPIFGDSDRHGNYIKVVGDAPRIAYTAHSDTVHKHPGRQLVSVEDDIVTTVNGSCLGADCTTGIWLMLGMIEAGVEGVYVVHAAEEIGGLGSAALVKDSPDWLTDVDIVISFDRFGTSSIITHQGGSRTASDAFAHSLSKALPGLQMDLDPTGTYTDSVEYAHVVPECTNLSVGYYDQHTRKESQDLSFAEKLLERLIQADWSTLVVERDPGVPDDTYGYYTGSVDEVDEEEILKIQRLLIDRPGMVAELLCEYGFTLDGLCEELDLDFCDRTFYADLNIF